MAHLLGGSGAAQLASAPTPGAAGAGIHQSAVLYQPDPEYSDAARRLELDGRVVLVVRITPEGTAADVRVVKPLGAALDEQAAQAVGSWRFAPATLNGQPVPANAEVFVNFHWRAGPRP